MPFCNVPIQIGDDWDDRRAKYLTGVGLFGICHFRLFNKALLGKWLWKFVVEGGSSWRRVVSCKYTVENACGLQMKSTFPTE